MKSQASDPRPNANDNKGNAVLGRDLSLEELDRMASKLPWVIPNVFIMPPHEYVVEKNLKADDELDAFVALSDACAHHPNRWRAFFRAYKARNSYIEAGEYRYWYSQIGAARMMNRSYREHEVENIRGSEGDRAVKNWSGSPYAWRREFGIRCENLHRYCNLLVVQLDKLGEEPIAYRYAAMVLRNAVSCWKHVQKVPIADEETHGMIYKFIHGVEALKGKKVANSIHVTCSDSEMPLKAVWMTHKEMDLESVATDLRCYSTAPRLEVESIFPLQVDGCYLIQLNVPSE